LFKEAYAEFLRLSHLDVNAEEVGVLPDTSGRPPWMDGGWSRMGSIGSIPTDKVSGKSAVTMDSLP